MRVWFLDETESVCPGCASGCNVKLGVARRQVQRLLPRRNDQVNQTWMCDEGRLGYRFVNERRLRVPLVRREGELAAATWDEAYDEAARRLGALARVDGGIALAAVVAPHLTNEELFTLHQVIAGGLRTTQVSLAIRTGPADDFLIKAEKAANGRGARDLGLGDGDLATIRAAIEAGTIRGLYVIGSDLWEVWGEGTAALLERLETLVVQLTNAHPLIDLAHVVLPGLTFAEKNGTLTNWAGQVQRIHQALDPAEQPSDGEIFLQVGRRLGMEIPPSPFDPRAILEQITRTVPRYHDVGWEALGSLGVPTAEV
jgi:NADH-quinone oxidoreductase subunit G